MIHLIESKIDYNILEVAPKKINLNIKQGNKYNTIMKKNTIKKNHKFSKSKWNILKIAVFLNKIHLTISHLKNFKDFFKMTKCKR